MRQMVAKVAVLSEPARMAVVWLRLSLTKEMSVGRPFFPNGVVLRAFGPDRHARQARALLNQSYTSGGGDVQAFEDWWPALQADAEYDADLCFVVEDERTNTLVAFAQCWTSAFVKDIAVAPSHRNQGVARGLLQAISICFAARGHAQLDLKVMANNVPAVELYRSLGFRLVKPD